ncbi:MAG: tRNA pseudouridine(38-40) synthase TruA, partial [Spirochaetaceae bacterium]|nr:tRNA pseudouridine(38-40) synthase TruA [Spirochaetaceae bacterium]
YLESAIFYPEGQQLVFEISANAFLWKMVRSIVGSLIHYEAQGKDAGFFREILEKKDRRLAGPTAPPQGLFLWNVSFSGQRRH